MMKINKIKYLVLALIVGLTLESQGQQDTYVAPTGTMYTHPGGNATVFGNLINDATGGVNHNNGGDLYIYRAAANGAGNSRIYDGPMATAPTDDYNAGGAYIRAYNLHTDNTVGTAAPSGTVINTSSGSGEIQVEQEVKITNEHSFDNGMVWTPRDMWKHAFVHYEATASYLLTAASNTTGKHIDGYAAYTGGANFIFPIGDGVRVRQSALNSPTTGTYKSAYFAKDATSGTTGISGANGGTAMIDNIQKVNTTEFWDIDGTESSDFTLTALNTVAGYSEWATEFAGFPLTDATVKMVITAFDPWEGLGMSTVPGTFAVDGDFTTTVATDPDLGGASGNPFSAYTWAIQKIFELNPDINAGITNTDITGDISTNDESVPAGSTYDGSNITADPANPGSAVPVIAADGTYTFNSPVTGEFNFLVPVCPPGVTTNCPEELLTITVIDASPNSTHKDPPIANTDLSATPLNTPVDINVKSNDAEGEVGHGLSAPTVTSAPSNGTAVVNADGTIKYTPNNGFVGIDTFSYEICDSFATPIECDTALVIVTVPPPGTNSIEASDDFEHIEVGGFVTNNALNNDHDPEGTMLTVSNPTTAPVLIPGVGTYTIASDGTYTFQGEPGWVGNTNFVYEVCDADGVCTEATVYIVATPPNVFGISLLDFTATSEECNTLLSWTTSKEENTDYASVQRSDDGRNFTTIATVDLSGNTTQPTTYSYTDVSLESGTYFYRLQFVDIDGSTEFSDVIAVSTSCSMSDNSRVTIYPNPGPGAYHMDFRGYAEDTYTVSVYSVIGQKVFERTVVISSSAQNEELDLSAFSSGPYMLKITNGRDFAETIKLIKE